MARDVSAFANADGGQLIYGMTEKDHEPGGLDQGIDAKVYAEIWFEQVLQQHLSARLASGMSKSIKRRGRVDHDLAAHRVVAHPVAERVDEVAVVGIDHILVGMRPVGSPHDPPRRGFD